MSSYLHVYINTHNFHLFFFLISIKTISVQFFWFYLIRMICYFQVHDSVQILRIGFYEILKLEMPPHAVVHEVSLIFMVFLVLFCQSESVTHLHLMLQLLSFPCVSSLLRRTKLCIWLHHTYLFSINYMTMRCLNISLPSINNSGVNCRTNNYCF